MNVFVMEMGRTGLTIYARFRDQSTGYYWTGSVMEAYNGAHFTNYAVAAAEQSTSGTYLLTVPPTLPVASYDVLARKQAAGSPATTDPGWNAGSFSWDGTNILPADAEAIAEAVDTELSTVHGSGSWDTAGPSPPGTAKVFGYSLGKNGKPFNGRAVTLSMLNPPQFSGVYTIDPAPQTVYSGVDGYWYFLRPSGGTAQYRIIITDEGVDKTVSPWPDSDTELEDLP